MGKDSAMSDKRLSRSEVRGTVKQALLLDDFSIGLERILDLPSSQTANALLPHLCHADPEVKYRAAAAMGRVVANLAGENIESARVIARRLNWTLCEESGGCPFGAPEAFGEILACSPPLAAEFAPVLIAYVMPGGNYLDHPPLLAGAIWSIGRLAESNPDEARASEPYLLETLRHENASVRGMSAWALGLIGARSSAEPLKEMVGDDEPIELWRDNGMKSLTVGQVAQETIGLLK
jgi:HEAT repeat protein